MKRDKITGILIAATFFTTSLRSTAQDHVQQYTTDDFFDYEFSTLYESVVKHVRLNEDYDLICFKFVEHVENSTFIILDVIDGPEKEWRARLATGQIEDFAKTKVLKWREVNEQFYKNLIDQARESCEKNFDYSPHLNEISLFLHVVVKAKSGKIKGGLMINPKENTRADAISKLYEKIISASLPSQ